MIEILRKDRSRCSAPSPDADLLDDTKKITDWSFVHDDATAHLPLDVFGVNYHSTG